MKIGLLGGTFDPPHEGHLFLIRESIRILELDVIFVVPVGIPVHKEDQMFSPEERMEGLADLVNETEKVALLDIEIDGTVTGYTSETLDFLHDMFPEASLHLIVGSDWLEGISGWYDFQRIQELSSIEVFTRPPHVVENCPYNLHIIDTPDISSTEIRNRITQDG